MTRNALQFDIEAIHVNFASSRTRQVYDCFCRFFVATLVVWPVFVGRGDPAWLSCAASVMAP